MSSYKPFRSSTHIVKYADDVSIILPVYNNCFNDVSYFQNEINHFESWCTKHGMSINHAKTKVLNVNFRSDPLILCPMVENVSVLKVLGLYFNDKMTWSAH